jgi:hypothetical protein
MTKKAGSGSMNPFPLATTKLLGNYFNNRQREANMFLSTTPASIPVYRK